MSEAITDSAATVVYVCNLAALPGETSGMDAADHV